MELVSVYVCDDVPRVSYEYMCDKFGHVLSFGESEPFLKNLWGHIVADSRGSLLLEELGEVLSTSTNEIGACLRVRCLYGYCARMGLRSSAPCSTPLQRQLCRVGSEGCIDPQSERRPLLEKMPDTVSGACACRPSRDRFDLVSGDTRYVWAAMIPPPPSSLTGGVGGHSPKGYMGYKLRLFAEEDGSTARCQDCTRVSQLVSSVTFPERACWVLLPTLPRLTSFLSLPLEMAFAPWWSFCFDPFAGFEVEVEGRSVESVLSLLDDSMMNVTNLQDPFRTPSHPFRPLQTPSEPFDYFVFFKSEGCSVTFVTSMA